VAGLPGRLAQIPLSWARIAWFGLVAPHLSERGPLIVHQGVVQGEQGVLLAVRSDLRGWELPGGNAHPGEPERAAIRREVREETGVDVEVLAHVGDWVRSGFRPHVARIWRCRARGGRPTPSEETLRVAWFDPEALPATLLPWYREPLAHALAHHPTAVVRHERLGIAAVLAGMRIDLKMRLAGEPPDGS
jgi:ADP-ribose pyrophosphatase YjhB (NUDIX family)